MKRLSAIFLLFIGILANAQVKDFFGVRMPQCEDDWEVFMKTVSYVFPSDSTTITGAYAMENVDMSRINPRLNDIDLLIGGYRDSDFDVWASSYIRLNQEQLLGIARSISKYYGGTIEKAEDGYMVKNGAIRIKYIEQFNLLDIEFRNKKK